MVKDIIKKQEQEHSHPPSSPKAVASPASSATTSATASTVDKGDIIEPLIKGVDNVSVAGAAVAAAAADNLAVVPTTTAAAATGHKIEVDFSSMANHTNLTALPRVPNANLKITNVESPPSPPATAAVNATRTTGGIPSFIQTPTKLISAKINSVQCLTNPDALKRTLLVEFGFEDDVDYAPGDSFGIWAPNDESLVRGVLTALNVKDEDLNKHYKLEGEGKKKKGRQFD